MAAAAAARKVTSVVIPTPPPTDWDLGTKVAAAQVATVIPANNIHPLAPAEMVRRAAIMNRFRIRVCDEARQRGDRTDLEMTASAALLRASTGHHGVGFVADPRTSVRRTPADCRPISQLQQTMTTLATPSNTTSASRWATTPGTVVPRRAESQPPPHNYRTSRSSSPGSPSKVVRPLDSRCPSPRLRPLRSPERPAVRSQDLDSAVDDDQLLTFSATDYSDDFADPDDGEIYTDFSLIFGGSSEEKVAEDSERDAVEYSSGADEHFEDYMDDLDGIPWDAR
ncbi:hypothetical protein VP1G_09462 [Cytospora mali]|uniref:Uncharacterized protein n=1 Tax=Cytospora mali TaxID=578113 RepID=A0A194VEA9_CYTMA|nr:hypothetical protein VP1G_09462 [Valsa mali var. pyri (nom. inval.)]